MNELNLTLGIIRLFKAQGRACSFMDHPVDPHAGTRDAHKSPLDRIGA